MLYWNICVLIWHALPLTDSQTTLNHKREKEFRK